MSQERRKFDKEFNHMTMELSKTRENLNVLDKELGFGWCSSVAGTQSFLIREEGVSQVMDTLNILCEEATIARFNLIYQPD